MTGETDHRKAHVLRHRRRCGLSLFERPHHSRGLSSCQRLRRSLGLPLFGHPHYSRGLLLSVR